MTATVSADVRAAVNDLNARWDNLRPVDRALAVRALKGKVRFRLLAKELGCSESLLRNLDNAAQAAKADLDIARKEQVSMRKLVSRGKEAQKQQAARDKEALDQKRTAAARKAAITICEWLEEKNFPFCVGEAFVDSVRRVNGEGKEFKELPKDPPLPPGTPIPEIIARLRPRPMVNSKEGDFDFNIAWLARWTYYAFPDPWVRDRALDIALDYQIKGIPVSELKKRRGKTA